MGDPITMVSLVFGAASVGSTIAASNAQKDAIRLQKQQRELQARAERRRLMREMQIKQAMALATAQGAGAATSSPAVGGIGALTSQLGSAYGFQSQYNNLSSGIENAQLKAMNADTAAAIFGKLFDIAPNFVDTE